MTKARARERAKTNALKKKKKRVEAAAQPDSNVTSGHIDKKANPMKPTTGPGAPTRISKGSARSR
ncbi:MAG: hypothetical protein ACKVIF_14885 [Rhodospirillales bacterium]|jgi:hypothetical protein